MNQSFQVALGSKPLPEGTLFYIVGISGEGQARLLEYARARLSDDHLVVFAHRYVTRSTDADREYEIQLSAAEFALRKRHGLFAMN
jgi:ribose 1,5-bisphosphokinase